MKLSENIKIIDLALYLVKEKTLIISDLHLGLEESLNRSGVLIPRSQFNDLINKLKLILKKVKVDRIILNGDLKHEFGRISKQEWNDLLKLFDFLKNKEVIIIKGNHDSILKPIAEKSNLKLVDRYDLKNITILHGDKVLENLNKTIIIGHEHPAISLKKGIRVEKYPCFLKGKYKKHNLIVLPSFNMFNRGTNILKGKLLSPFLKNIDKFDVYIAEPSESLNTTLHFGKVRDLKKL